MGSTEDKKKDKDIRRELNQRETERLVQKIQKCRQQSLVHTGATNLFIYFHLLKTTKGSKHLLQVAKS